MDVILGQNNLLTENSVIFFLAISLVLVGGFILGKKDMHWLSPGFNIGLNEQLSKFKGTYEN